MRRALLGLLVVALVLVGVAAYMLFFRESEWERLEKTCRGEGYAVVRYQGVEVVARYSLSPRMWNNRPYCDVWVEFPAPIGGLRGFNVPREEFESQLLVRYLSKEEAATLSRPKTLSGEWRSLGGAALTEWWNSLPEVEAEQLEGYVGALWGVMAGRGYDHVFQSQGWAEPPMPQPGQKVKVYSLRLWFGARLDVIAYQDYREPGRLVVVMYGAVENMTAWYDGIARLAVFNGLIPTWAGETLSTKLLWDAYGNGFGYNLVTPVGYGFAESLRTTAAYLEEVPARLELAVWKVRVVGGVGSLSVGGWALRPEVYWVLVEPLLAELYVATAEQLYWLVVGAPVFQLTANMVLPPGTSYLSYAEWVRDVVRGMLPRKTEELYPGHGPASMRLKGTICSGYSWASAMIASLAGGVPVALIDGLYPRNPAETHMISVIVLPSTIVRVEGDVRLVFDVDGDGVNETAIVLYDSARLSRRELEYLAWRHLEEEIVVPPYRLAAGMRSGDVMAMAGLAGYIDALGAPFKAPPAEEARRLVKPEIQWTWLREQWGAVPGPEAVMSPDATATLAYGGKGLYIWKVRKAGFMFRLPDDVTPEWFLHNVILPGKIDTGWLHARGGKPGDYFTATPPFVQELYTLFLERFWGIPEGYAPLPPPAAPVSIPPPPPPPAFS